MTLVNAQGRVFGRWNFIDVVIGVILLALIPITYAAYVLFRTPEPRLTAIEPAELVQGANRRVTISGVNLRPYLRVSFNNYQGATFLFEDTRRAAVDLLDNMPPGVYDVVLYDFGQERHRLPQALTITSPFEPKPAFETVLAGRFINLTQDAAAQLRPGKLSIPGELVEMAAPRPSAPRVYYAGAPVQLNAPSQLEVPALVRIPCIIKLAGGLPECAGMDVPLRPGTLLTIAPPGAPATPFQIDQLRGIDAVQSVKVTVRFTGEASALAAMKTGDADLERGWNPYSLGAVIATLQAPAGGTRVGNLDVRAQRLADGWWNGTATLRIGGQVAFVSNRYSVLATVLEINDPGR
ncbi:MAG TPA: hypothetical protein VJ691_18575 [Vicinamibacterales bacterium]|nr:hypothetical protein [Vicinamibacterales bacterium]